VSALLSCALSLVSGVARADGRALLVVPESAPDAVVEAITIELQLAGAEVIVERLPDAHASWPEAVALAAHASTDTLVAIEPRGGATTVRVRGAGEARAEGSVSGPLALAHPRALALVTASLLEAHPEVLTPREPDLGDADAGSALSSPALRVPMPFTRALGDPRAIARIPDDRPAPDPIEPRAEPLATEARVALELGLATGGAALFGLPAALIANALAAPGDDTPYWIYASATAATLGVGLGVYLGGILAGANGDPFWTILAAIAGGAIGGALMVVGAAVDRLPDDGVDTGFTLVGYVATVALPPLFGIGAFELTRDEE
jgi:hypothetical protein